MSWLDNQRTAHRLLVGFGIASLATLLTGVYGINAARQATAGRTPDTTTAGTARGSRAASPQDVPPADTNPLLLVTLIATGATLGCGWFVSQSVLEGQRRATRRLNAISRGQLNADAPTESGDDLDDAVSQAMSTTAAFAAACRETSAAVAAGMPSSRIDTAPLPGLFGDTGTEINAALESLARPLEAATVSLQHIGEGQTPAAAQDEWPREYARTRDAINAASESVRGVLDDIRNLSDAISRGHLDYRVQPEEHQAEFRAAIVALNAGIESMAVPMKRSIEHLENLSKGINGQPIANHYEGDTQRLVAGFNNVFASINRLIEDATSLAAAAQDGRLDVRADASHHEGDFRRIVEGINVAFETIAVPLGKAIDHLDRLSRGINGKPITHQYNGELQRLANGFNSVFTSIDRLIEDSTMLAAAAQEGKLDVRADASRHEGDFRRIVDGINVSFETIAVPLGKAIEHLADLSKGINGKQIDHQYKGELQRLADGFNHVFISIDRLIKDATQLAAAAQEGKLDVRADAEKHEGDFRRIVEGINLAFETIAVPLGKAIGHLDRLSRGINGKPIATQYQGELKRLADGFNVVFASIDRLIVDANTLAGAAVEGRLAARADATRHEGDFRAVIEGVNNTLDALTGPIQMAAQYMDKIAVGQIPAKITADYRGDFNEIKNNLNAMIAYLGEMTGAANAISQGDLSHDVAPKSADDALGAAFQRMIAYLKQMASVAEAISTGDLSSAVHAKSEADALGVAFERMVRELSQLIAQTHAASNEIANSSQEVAQGNEDLSERTSEQASSLEETASSMEEMTSTVKQNAENAAQAKSLAVQARDVAENGGEVVQHAVNSMSAINTASRRITDIISVIDEIAFQTNLLALNAAVEAARVGEQGRGFAVVAAEVRNLAQRSATAAKEIKALVQDSVTKVQEGTDLVNESGERLHDIVTSVKKVTDIVSEIAAASLEQSAGIEQVNKAVMQMDQITQQNAALVEEATAASQSMSEKARNLQGLVSRFKLDTQYMEGVARSAAAAKAANAPARALKATGTDGPVAPRHASAKRPSLQMIKDSEADFEDF